LKEEKILKKPREVKLFGKYLLLRVLKKEARLQEKEKLLRVLKKEVKLGEKRGLE